MAFFVFIFGIAIGSFINVLVDRLPRGESINGRSYCESCNKTLKAIDLIPIISFLLLRGKCRYCNAKLSYQYPLVELITGLFYFLTYYFVNHEIIDISLIFNLFTVSILISIFLIDFKNGIIPDKIVFPSIAISSVYLILFNQNIFLINLVSAIGAFLFFYFLFWITKSRGIGFGDVKFAFLLGIIFGFPGTFFTLYIAFLTGGLLGLILILWKKKRLKSQIPFGPLLIFGAFANLFFYQQILNFFQKIL